ncbi:antirestriction protein ArdA [Nitrincola sp. A-D6]|uniref:antirestriction protein ArdA n=1 Tax=Nitrincola sp. A-D6 TaxID=1545442 RepID=UPI00068990B8|nr:antirestriction protein ArdA [Nitrincola sp. A-D6]
MANVTFYSLSDYNNGLLISHTFDLDKLNSYDKFLEEMRDWLAEVTEDMDDGEVREEYIVADYDDVPEEYMGEWSLSPEYFDFAEKADGLGFEVVKAGVDLGIPLESIEDAYLGEFDSMEDYAEEFIDSTGMLDSMPESLRGYFDVSRFANDLSFDVNESNGHFFYANW